MYCKCGWNVWVSIGVDVTKERMISCCFFFCPSHPQSNRETRGWTLLNLTGLFPLRKRPTPFPLLCQTPLTETLTLFGVYYCWSLSLLSAWRSWCPSLLSSVPISHPARRLTSKSESSGSTAALWNINFEIVWNTTSSQKKLQHVGVFFIFYYCFQCWCVSVRHFFFIFIGNTTTEIWCFYADPCFPPAQFMVVTARIGDANELVN